MVNAQIPGYDLDMELQTTWWLSPLAEDHYTWLRQKEIKSLPPYRCQSPQLPARLYIVDWLAVICDASNICLTGRHLAVLLLDYFMDNHHVDRSQLKLIALCSLHIAAKFEECETNIPKVSELNRLAGSPGYSPHQFLEAEVKMLEFFNWSVNLPTAANFYDYYLVKAVSDDDLYNGRRIGNETTMSAAISMSKYVVYFLEVSLQDHVYRAYLPSLVCAACIASARHCFRIMPTWPTRLQELTGYSLVDLQPLVQHMMRSHERDDVRRQSTSPSKESFGGVKTSQKEPIESRVSAPIVYFLGPTPTYPAIASRGSFLLAPADAKIVLRDSYTISSSHRV